MDNTVKKISFSRLCSIEDKVEGYDWKPDDVFYTIDDIKEHIEPDLEKNFNFALWLLQKKPNSKPEQEARAYLLNLVNSCVEGDE